jgi:sodium pump decarboxylase gamma subunit
MVLQGLVILVVGLSMVSAFLLLLVLVMTVAGKIIPRFNHWLPDAPPKTKSKKHAASQTSVQKHEGCEGVAIAIAAAFSKKQQS